MDISTFDVWIVRFGTVFLVAVAYEDTKMCRFSESKYDAVQFTDMNDAIWVAKRSGGEVVRFNPITGKISVPSMLTACKNDGGTE